MLDLGRMKVVANSDHLGIWKPDKVEKAIEWLKEVLGSSQRYTYALLGCF
jgi:hypothetical protein